MEYTFYNMQYVLYNKLCSVQNVYLNRGNNMLLSNLQLLLCYTFLFQGMDLYKIVFTEANLKTRLHASCDTIIHLMRYYHTSHAILTALIFQNMLGMHVRC